MAKISFTVPSDEAYVPMAEGTYVFRIKEFTINKDGTQCKGVFVTKDGEKLVEKYNFFDENEEVRPSVVTSLARVIAGAMDMDKLPATVTEKNVENCVGRYITADVRHSEYNGRVFDHIDSYSIKPADGYAEDDADEENDNTNKDNFEEDDDDEDDLFDDED